MFQERSTHEYDSLTVENEWDKVLLYVLKPQTVWALTNYDIETLNIEYRMIFSTTNIMILIMIISTFIFFFFSSFFFSYLLITAVVLETQAVSTAQSRHRRSLAKVLEAELREANPGGELSLQCHDFIMYNFHVLHV